MIGTPQFIENTKQEFLEFLDKVKREGIEDLKEYLINSSFFTCPASQYYHANYPGGLAWHSLNLTKIALSLNKMYRTNIPEESIIISGLCHDLCKIGNYTIEYKRLLACYDHPKQYLDEPKTFGNQMLIKEKNALAIGNNDDLEKLREMIENMEIAENPEVCQDITEEVSSVSDEVALENEEVISDAAEYEEVFFEMDEGEYSSCIEDYFFGIGRYETIAMDTSSDEEKTLYVFAKSLNAEHNFSSKLISCCRRLANVHNYSQVKLLSNPQFIEENREKFSDFMKEKDVIYACSVDSLSLMTEDEKDLCGLLGIALDRDGLIEQSKTASDKNAPFIKLLIQDNID